MAAGCKAESSQDEEDNSADKLSLSVSHCPLLFISFDSINNACNSVSCAAKKLSACCISLRMVFIDDFIKVLFLKYFYAKLNFIATE
jgi:hypothetical protein